MNIAIMQPYFFPYLPYFMLMKASDIFVCYDDVNFIKQGWLNRNYVFNGKDKILFSVPLINQSSFKKINETEICYSTNWDAKFLKTLRLIYKSAPYFDITYSLCETVLSKKLRLLSELNFTSLKAVTDYLQLDCQIISSSSTIGFKELKSTARVLAIADYLKATSYINLMGGQDLYSKDHFLLNGIELKFLKSEQVPYLQSGKNFTPNLSIIDVLMYNDIKEIQTLLAGYQLI